jgi:hypothetical protein
MPNVTDVHVGFLARQSKQVWCERSRERGEGRAQVSADSATQVDGAPSMPSS